MDPKCFNFLLHDLMGQLASSLRKEKHNKENPLIVVLRLANQDLQEEMVKKKIKKIIRRKKKKKPKIKKIIQPSASGPQVLQLFDVRSHWVLASSLRKEKKQQSLIVVLRLTNQELQEEMINEEEEKN